jgi:hypothetical protein
VVVVVFLLVYICFTFSFCNYCFVVNVVVVVVVAAAAAAGDDVVVVVVVVIVVGFGVVVVVVDVVVLVGSILICKHKYLSGIMPIKI